VDSLAYLQWSAQAAKTFHCCFGVLFWLKLNSLKTVSKQFQNSLKTVGGQTTPRRATVYKWPEAYDDKSYTRANDGQKKNAWTCSPETGNCIPPVINCIATHLTTWDHSQLNERCWGPLLVGKYRVVSEKASHRLASTNRTEAMTAANGIRLSPQIKVSIKNYDISAFYWIFCA